MRLLLFLNLIILIIVGTLSDTDNSFIQSMKEFIAQNPSSCTKPICVYRDNKLFSFRSYCTYVRHLEESGLKYNVFAYKHCPHELWTVEYIDGSL